MKYKLIGNKYKVSCVGIGGHYSKMEEGEYEERFATITIDEIKSRTEFIEKAVKAGITYFDTTWQNEVHMLSKVIEQLNNRDEIFVNGMVLGAFAGSEDTGMEVCDYFNKWLDKRLQVIPGNHFDSIMINAIEERYDEAKCEKLVRLLEKRRQNGDFEIFGFSCHNSKHARVVADTFKEFEIIMLPYNFRNRTFETAFKDYSGNASFVAMKPLIWAEYGIPFCSLNNLPDLEESLGLKPVHNVASLAVNWVASKDTITTTVCAINSQEELDQLIEAGSSDISKQSEAILSSYDNAIQLQNYIPFFISAIYGNDDNRRKRFFGLINLAKALKVTIPEIPLNIDESDEILSEFKTKLLVEATKQGFKPL